MLNLSKGINEIEDSITYKIKHTYLNKYIPKPIIDKTKLAILFVIVNNTALSAEKKKQYIIAATLIQVALDTHELVPVTDEQLDNDRAITSKQLTVLAGDYYSGLYYLLLAEINDVELIRTLALAIKKITEYKMKLYYREVDSFVEYLSITKEVESLLITSVAEFVNHSIVNDITGKLIITNKLIEESKSCSGEKQFPVLDNWLAFSDDSYASISFIVEETIQTNIREIEAFLSQPTLRISVFKTQFKYMLDQFIYNNISIAEEG